MQVNLIKIDEASFSLQEDKCEKISHRLFRQLLDFKCGEGDDTDGTPKMVVFKTKEDYMKDVCKYDVDLSKDMYVNDKGNIFCFLNSNCGGNVVEQEDKEDK